MNLVVANWKMNPGTIEEARVLASRVESGLLAVDRSRVETVLCPPFVFMPAIRHSMHFAALGAQNVAAEKDGAFTGEVSADQLAAAGVKYVIIGHSERRSGHGEDDETISKKVQQAIRSKIFPILCVGFGVKKGAALMVVKSAIKRQITAGLSEVSLGKADLAVAYEPVWAISHGLGTGRAVKPQHAAEVMTFIRGILPRARLLYGGSVDRANAASFAAEPVISGALVGGASLDAAEFLQIIKAFSI